MNSMTGHGVGEASNDALTLTAEAKSYNNRFLDVSLNLPGFLRPLEARVRAEVARRVQRGRVDVALSATEQERPVHIEINRFAATAYLAALRELAGMTGLADQVRLIDLARMDGVISLTTAGDPEGHWPTCLEALGTALGQLADTRGVEGLAIRTDLQRGLQAIGEMANEIERLLPASEQRITAEVKRRLQELLSGDSSDERIVAAAAVLLVKGDVHEELHRLRAHIAGMQEALAASDQAIGKRLEFYCQELLRETNTLGAKSGEAPIDRQVVLMKEQVERLREQVRNVE